MREYDSTERQTDRQNERSSSKGVSCVSSGGWMYTEDELEIPFVSAGFVDFQFSSRSWAPKDLSSPLPPANLISPFPPHSVHPLLPYLCSLCQASVTAVGLGVQRGWGDEIQVVVCISGDTKNKWKRKKSYSMVLSPTQDSSSFLCPYLGSALSIFTPTLFGSICLTFFINESFIL